MTEFKEAIRKYHKMCEHYVTCRKGCPLKRLMEELNYKDSCLSMISEYADDAEKIIMEWEKPIDWSKVEVDTKILVKQQEDNCWEKRHFARFENGKVYAWTCGMSSYTAPLRDDVADWRFAKLAEEGEQE